MAKIWGDKSLVKRELAILQKCSDIDHPNLLKIYFCYDETNEEDLGSVFLVMEKCQGGSLEQLIRKKGGRFTERQVVEIALQIADGLETLHDKLGVTHRDLKPENILFRNDLWKLTDFGLSTDQKQHKTQAGTPAYMAPEFNDRLRVRDKSVDI